MKVSVIVSMQDITNHTLKTANTSFELDKYHKNVKYFHRTLNRYIIREKEKYIQKLFGNPDNKKPFCCFTCKGKVILKLI
jgi:hypothetical protein